MNKKRGKILLFSRFALCPSKKTKRFEDIGYLQYNEQKMFFFALNEVPVQRQQKRRASFSAYFTTSA